jgi:K+-sensing histidine kinase KdpD
MNLPCNPILGTSQAAAEENDILENITKTPNSGWALTTKKVGSGTGLGLSVTYGIIKMHRGDITVDSRSDPARPPTGTTFTVKLPTGRSEMPLTAARQQSIGEEGI